MLAAEGFRHQHLHRLTEEFFALVTEQLFGLSVNQDDLARRVHEDHGIGREFEQAAKYLLGGAGLGGGLGRELRIGRVVGHDWLRLGRTQASAFTTF